MIVRKRQRYRLRDIGEAAQADPAEAEPQADGRANAMPSIRSRITALLLLAYVFGPTSSLWRVWRNGMLGLLLGAGVLGPLLVTYWTIAFGLGLFGCVQLWRRRRTGRLAGIIVVGYGLAMDLVVYLLADAGHWLPLVPTVTVKVALLLALMFGLPVASRHAPESTALDRSGHVGV